MSREELVAAGGGGVGRPPRVKVEHEPSQENKKPLSIIRGGHRDGDHE